jgi:D-alanyl-D-alanine carboxypeptidase (penicillin-binding protein 5/6)
MPPWIASADSSAKPELVAESAILIDYKTGNVLYEKRADAIVPPASLTKIMTTHLVLEQARAGRVALDKRFEVPPQAWARNMPPDSSLMFLGPGQHVTLNQLMEGLVIASGNDAAVAVALRLAGSVERFVEMMNAEAEQLGYDVMRFHDPAGLSPRNRVTAREYADFLSHHINRWPNALDEFYSKREIVYPTQANFDSVMIGGSVRQENRNPLLFDYPGVDGMKTGYIDSSGYNLAVSAERDGRRLIGVVLGVRAASAREGTEQRARDGARLLDYGFDHFRYLRPSAPEPQTVRVWKGREEVLQAVAAARPGRVVVPRGRRDPLEVSVVVEESVVAPVDAGTRVGTATYRIDGHRVERIPLVAERGIAQAGLFTRLWHSLVLLLRSVFG